MPRVSTKPDDEIPPGAGLECRRCGCKHFRVVYARRTANYGILRLRECRHCGRRISTVEKEKRV